MTFTDKLEMLRRISQYSCSTLTPEIEDDFADGHLHGYNECVRDMCLDLLKEIEDELLRRYPV